VPTFIYPLSALWLMDAMVITQKGAEGVAALDIKDILGCESVLEETVALFDADDVGLLTLSYRSQAISRVLRLITVTEVNNHLEESISAMKRALAKADLSFISGKLFRVNCIRSGEEDYSSQDLAALLGESLVEHGGRVSLEKPEIIILAYVWHGKAYVGRDITGLDLGKREYRVFNHPSSLSGITAYASLRLSGYKPGQALLDPFCGAGTIIIEAALYATRISPNRFRRDRFSGLSYKDSPRRAAGILGYDHLLRYVIAAKKNACIAGVEKDMTVSKVEVEWLDTKVDKAAVDTIITHPPSPSRLVNQKELEKVYKEFLYQSDYVLKKDGRITVILQNPQLFTQVLDKDKRWVLQSQNQIWQGSQGFTMLFIGRGRDEAQV
jgi:23S rRNA G2445 N2-methylase RlmL